MRGLWLAMVCCCVLLPGAASWAAPEDPGRELAPGLTYRETRIDVSGRSVHVRVLKRGPAARFHLVPAVPPQGMRHPATLQTIARKHGAVAAINGGFFGPGGFPIGTIVIEGQVASLDTRQRSAIGVLSSGVVQIAPLEAKAFVTFDDYFEPIWLWGYNQPLKSSAVVLYNRWLGQSTVNIGGRGVRLADGTILATPGSGSLRLGGTPPVLEDPPVEAGPKRVMLSNKDLPSRAAKRPALPTGPAVLGFAQSAHPSLQRAKVEGRLYEGVVLPPHWKQASSILTAGPLLVEAGRTTSQAGNPEGFSQDILGSAKRSLVGLTRLGEILFIQIPEPVSLDTAAEVALALNCRSALNLDGGGSIGLWAKDQATGEELCQNCAGRQLGSALLLMEGSGVGGPTVPWFDGTIFDAWKEMQ